jgi:hypothetical protein
MLAIKALMRIKKSPLTIKSWNKVYTVPFKSKKDFLIRTYTTAKKEQQKRDKIRMKKQ